MIRVANTEVLAGTLLFLAAGILLVLIEIPREFLGEWELQGWLPLTVLLFLPAAGIAVGYCLNFPRWSYAYVGMQFFMSLYMAGVSTPDLRFLGCTAQNGEVWGWRAWVPLLAAILVGLLVRRSPRSLGRFFTNLGADATQLSFALFGFFPLLIWISFDEVRGAYSAPWMALLGAGMTAAAWLYLRQRGVRRRAAALAGGALLLLAGIILSGYLYWGAEGADLGAGIMFSLTIAVVMLLPALLGVLHNLFEPAST